MLTALVVKLRSHPPFSSVWHRPWFVGFARLFHIPLGRPGHGSSRNYRLRGMGHIHDGSHCTSFLFNQIQFDARSVVSLHTFLILFLVFPHIPSILHIDQTDFAMKLLHPTSTGIHRTHHPAASHDDVSVWYFVLFLSFAVSMFYTTCGVNSALRPNVFYTGRVRTLCLSLCLHFARQSNANNNVTSWNNMVTVGKFVTSQS